MKSAIFAVAAAIATSASASHLKRHAHEAVHQEIKLRALGTGTSGLVPTGIPSNSTCGCSTVYETITGEWSCKFTYSSLKFYKQILIQVDRDT